MRNPGGYAFIVNPTPGKIVLDGGRVETAKEGVTEYDTFSCGHCNKVTHVRVKERAEDIGGLCKQCMKLICPVCVDEWRCTPLEKKIEEQEQRDYLRLSYGTW
jgi:hypothetical protein